MASRSSLVTTRLKRRAAPILVCRKCLKRADGGKAVKLALKSELKSRRDAHGRKPPKLVMTSCFGLCPKRAVVVASAATLARNEYLLLDDGDSAAAAITRLLPDQDR